MEAKNPMYWELLSESGSREYLELRQKFCLPAQKTKKTNKVEEFENVITDIESFERKSEEEMWKRCLVCGFVRLGESIAVNISQLKRLIPKCKTSINGSLSDIGFSHVATKEVGFSELTELIPVLSGNLSELRQWTIRAKSAADHSSEKASPHEEPNSVTESIFQLDFMNIENVFQEFDTEEFGGDVADSGDAFSGFY